MVTDAMVDGDKIDFWSTGCHQKILLRGAGYLGYVDSNQGEITSISVGYMPPNPRVIKLHRTSYIQYPEPLSKHPSGFFFFSKSSGLSLGHPQSWRRIASGYIKGLESPCP